MASQKIGIVFAVDGEKELKSALQAAKKETGLYQTALKNLSKESSDSKNSLKYLQDQQEKLSSAQKAWTDRVKIAQDGLKNATDTYNNNRESLEKLRAQYDEAKDKLREMKEAGDTSSESYRQQKDLVDKLATAVSQQAVVVNESKGKVNDWNRELNTAESGLRQCNSEIDKNEQYLKEAKDATDGCATSIDKYGNEVKEAKDDQNEFNESLSSIVKNRIADFAVDALRGLGEKAKEAAKYVVEVGSSFEAQMSKVSAISGATGGDFDALKDKAMEMGRTTVFSASDAGSAMEYMAMAGWKTSDMLNGISGIMDLAAASGENLGTASDIVTDALTAFGQSAAESGRLADIMAAASSNANTNVSMMGETFKYAAPVAGALGYTMEDTALAIGLMANAGIKASQAGTSLRGGLTNLVKPGKQAAEAMDQYKISVTDDKGNMRSFRDLIEHLRERLGGLSEKEQAAAAAALFGKNAMSGWLAIINAAPGDVDKLTNAIDNSAGTAKKMADIMVDNFPGAVQLFNSATESLGITLYNYFSGPLTKAVSLATDLINGITNYLTPTKSIVTEYINEVDRANQSVKASIDHANQVVADAVVEAERLDASKKVITDILDNAQKVNEIDLGKGRTAIVNAAGEIISFGYKPLEEGTEDIKDDLDSLNDVNLGNAKTILIEYGDAGETAKGKIDELGNIEIDTTGIEVGTDAIIKVMDDVTGETETAKGTITGLGEIRIDTGTTAESINTVVTALSRINDVDTSQAAEQVYLVTDAYDKFAMSKTVEAMSAMIPELSQAWDDQGGVLRATTEDLNNWFETEKAVVLQSAFLEKQKELLQAQADAIVNNAMALQAQSKAMDTYGDSVEKNTQYVDEWGNVQTVATKGTEEGRAAIEKANVAVKESEENMQAANEAVEIFDQVMKDTLEPLGLSADSMNEMADAAKADDEALNGAGVSAEGAADALDNLEGAEEDAAEDAEKLAEEQEKLSKKIDKAKEAFEEAWGSVDAFEEKQKELGDTEELLEWAEAQVEYINDVTDAYKEMVEKIQSGLDSYVRALDTSGEEGSSALDNMITNMNEKSAELEEWVENMKILGERAGRDLPQGLYDELVAAGPEKTREAVQELVNAAEGETDKFREVAESYEHSLSVKSSAEVLASYTSAGKAYASALSGGYVDGTVAETPVVESASTNMMGAANTAATQEATNAMEAGKEAVDSLSEGIDKNQKVAEQSAEAVVDIAADAASKATAKFAEGGARSVTTYAGNIDLNKNKAKKAAENLANDAATAATNKASAFVTSGAEAVTKYTKGISDNQSRVRSAAESAVSQGVDAAKRKSDEFNTAGRQAMSSMAKGVTDGQPAVANAARNAVTNAKNEASGEVNGFNTIGNQIPVKIADGIRSNGTYIVNATVNAIRDAKNNASAETSYFSGIGERIPGSIANGITIGKWQVSSSGVNVVSGAFVEMNNYANRWDTFEIVGGNISAGISRGIYGRENEVYNAARIVASNALDAAQRVLGIHSPSVAFEKGVGEQADRGAALGFEKNSGLVEDAARGMAKDAIRAASDEMSKSAGTQLDMSANLTIDTVQTVRQKVSTESIKVSNDLANALVSNEQATAENTRAINALVNAFKMPEVQEPRPNWKRPSQSATKISNGHLTTQRSKSSTTTAKTGRR